MNFIHKDKDFPALVRIVSGEAKLSPGLVEKDYWVTHTLWALHQQGFEIWFKGGTSLSKGFGLIQRFSEDLDLRIDPGKVPGLLVPPNWKSAGRTATTVRGDYFKGLTAKISVPEATASLDPIQDQIWRSANIRVVFKGRLTEELDANVKPYVLLEVGYARVTPFIACDLSSFIHEKLRAQGQAGSYLDNRPRGVRCVHPAVTLIEKLDAIERKAMNAAHEPPTFVRHFEDAARVIEKLGSIKPPIEYPNARQLMNEMLAKKDIRQAPTSASKAFNPDGGDRWKQIANAYEGIRSMYWGDRLSLAESCQRIRDWIENEFR